METYKVPSTSGHLIHLGPPFRDPLPGLDVVWANQFESESTSPEQANKKEVEFYKGAPPQWLNFYLAEKRGSPFFKRNLYRSLWQEITGSRNKSWSTVTISMFHEPGSGGSTVAMQVLWELRKELRCARVRDSFSNTEAIAEQVVSLFSAGGSQNQNTVLLLLDNAGDGVTFQDNLEDSLVEELKVKNISSTIPVVIILNCVRKKDVSEQRNSVKRELSECELQKLREVQDDIVQRHGGQHQLFYAFNIMQRNYDPAYIQQACGFLQPLKSYRRPRKAQLFSFLSLLNSYIPGSSLPHDLCQKFVQKGENHFSSFSWEEHMKPFTDFLVVFSTQEEEGRNEDKHVRMAHPMIAQECLRMLTKAGVKKSDTTLKLLTESSLDGLPPYLLKKLLTKREIRPEGQEEFSKLILDIHQEEGPSFCIPVLKHVSKKYAEDPFYPQALARFYYLKKGDYVRAEHWAKKAIERAEKNSFIKDTLGQVHKHQLKNLKSKTPKQILQVGKRASEAFKDEAKTADEELGLEMQDHNMINKSNTFNTRGLFGFLEVAHTILYHIGKDNVEWTRILTKETSSLRFLIAYDGGKCARYERFLTRLRDEVQEKFEFFEWFLLFSKPGIDKNEPEYFWPKVDYCHKAYVPQSSVPSTFAGLLYSLDQDLNTQDLEENTIQWAQMHSQSPSDLDVVQNYILSNVVLSQSNAASKEVRPLGELQAMLQRFWEEQKQHRSPEFYLLTLLLFWPDVECGSVDVSCCVGFMHQAFEMTYKNKLRSRFLVPLFFLAEGHGLQKVIHVSRLDRNSMALLAKGANRGEIPGPKRVQGEVRNLKVFAMRGSENIEVSPHPSTSVRHPGCDALLFAEPLIYIWYENVTSSLDLSWFL